MPTQEAPYFGAFLCVEELKNEGGFGIFEPVFIMKDEQASDIGIFSKTLKQEFIIGTARNDELLLDLDE